MHQQFAETVLKGVQQVYQQSTMYRMCTRVHQTFIKHVSNAYQTCTNILPKGEHVQRKVTLDDTR